MTFNPRKLAVTLGLASALCLPAVAQISHFQPQHDQDDRDRARGGDYNQDSRYHDSSAYERGYKDGDHDRSKHRPERADRHHFKNDNDRMAYEAGYRDAYSGGRRGNDHDRDDRR